MNLNKKASFSLIELLASIFIISLISIYAMKFYKHSFTLNQNEFEKEKIKLEFLTAKLILEKRKSFEKLSLKDKNLYYENSLLLKDITKYNFYENSNYAQLNICIKDNLCQEMVISK